MRSEPRFKRHGKLHGPLLEVPNGQVFGAVDDEFAPFCEDGYAVDVPPGVDRAPARGGGFMVQGSEFRVQGSGFGVQGSGFRVRSGGLGFRCQGSRFRVRSLGLGFWVWGSGFRVWGLGFRAYGLGFWV
jgi:hypothetical protein